MHNWIQRLFQPSNSLNSEPADGLVQPQREAIIELLLLMMYADHRVAVSEDTLIDQQLGQFDWQSGIQPEYFLNQATQRVRAVLDQPDKVTQLLTQIDAALATPQARQQALQLCERVANSDRSLAPSESSFLNLIKQTIKS